jgi:hypothetical protein
MGRKITLAKDLHDWGRWAVFLLNYTLAFALQLKKSTENLNQGSRVVKTTRCADQTVFRNSFGRPAVHQFTSVTRVGLQSALGQHKCLPSCRCKGFPAFNSRTPPTSPPSLDTWILWLGRPSRLSYNRIIQVGKMVPVSVGHGSPSSTLSKDTELTGCSTGSTHLATMPYRLY